MYIEVGVCVMQSMLNSFDACHIGQVRIAEQFRFEGVKDSVECVAFLPFLWLKRVNWSFRITTRESMIILRM